MRLRIGFNARCLADPRIRGLVRYSVGLLRALSELKELDLVLFSLEEPCPDHLRGIRAKVVTFSAPREFLWNDVWLPRMIRREGVEVFHALADRGLPLVKPCPLVVTVHNSFERAHRRSLFPTVKQRLWYWKNELVNAALSDAVLTVSRTTRDELVGLGVVPARKLHVVHPAPAPEFRADPSPADDATIRAYGISRPYVLYVGGYDAHKNVDALVRAFDRSELADHQLVVAAHHQWEYQRFVARWRSLACFDRMRLIEVRTEDLPAIYRRTSFFVNPSLWESFSFQLTEAMACGVPILASSRGAMPEIVGGAALLFDPGDVDELARLMRLLAVDADLRDDLRGRGLERARSFSWTRTARETLRRYRSLVTHRRGGSLAA